MLKATFYYDRVGAVGLLKNPALGVMIAAQSTTTASAAGICFYRV